MSGRWRRSRVAPRDTRGSGHLTGVSGRGLELAYRYLSRRERTTLEVRQHLLREGVEEPEADAAIQELVEGGCLDDARFARLFVEDKRELEQWGAERIRRGLSSRGIDRELADAALAEQNAPEDPCAGELSRALVLLGRRFPTALRDRRQRDRALGVLLRKGYEPELAFEAVRVHGRT